MKTDKQTNENRKIVEEEESVKTSNKNYTSRDDTVDISGNSPMVASGGEVGARGWGWGGFVSREDR